MRKQNRWTGIRSVALMLLLATVVQAGAIMTPSGGEAIADRRPQFFWPAVSGATWYQLWISRNGQTHVMPWVQGGTTWTPLNDLFSGRYRWWVRSWGPEIGMGTWSSPASFSLPSRLPGAIALIGPEGAQPGHNLTYRWQHDANATWYRLWVGRQGAGTWHDRWYNLTGDGEAAVALANHPRGTFTWWLLPWGPDGFGPWSGPGAFTTPSQAPTVPALVAPLGETVENPPVFAWESERADWYRVYVQRVGGGAVLDRWTADTTLTPAAALPAGQYAWWVGAWNSVTRRVVWSQRGDFDVTGTPPAVPGGMVLIPGGTNSVNDPDFGVYSLTVTAFYMDQYEVTKALWDKVYNWAVANGYSFDNAGRGKAANHPVHTVNWYDVVKWCNARSQKEGRPAVYTVNGVVYKTGRHDNVVQTSAVGYRLPTETEWEYAARGGLSGRRFPWGDGDEIQHARANYYSDSFYSYDTSPTRGNHPTYNAGTEPYTSSVGSFAANGYGLYDMAGNVWEWCFTASGSYRVIRGGSWFNDALCCRVGRRRYAFPHRGWNYGGFRAVLPPGQQ